MIGQIPNLGQNWQMLIEVAIFATGVYLVLRFLRETRGSGVIRGLTIILLAAILIFVTMIALLDLKRLEIVFTQVGTLAGVGLIVIFQPEIRRAIVKLGDSWVFRRFLQRDVKIVSRMLRSVARLSRDNIGALIAIEREGSLASLAETGINIDAELNSYLIESVFYPGSALHDGAIIIRDDRIVAASCLLPLSQNPEVDKRLGTRHRAALGLAEETDALAIVVSEETGKVSAAMDGKLHHGLTLEELEHTIEASLRDTHRARTGKKGEPERRRRFKPLQVFRDPWRKLASIALATLLWFVLDTQVQTSDEFEVPAIAYPAGQEMPRTNILAVSLPSADFKQRADGTLDSQDRPVEFITIKVRGPTNLIERMGSNYSFMVDGLVPEPLEGRDDLYVITITERDIKHTDRELNGLITSIEPTTVRILLAKTERQTITFSRNNILPNEDDPDLAKRVRWDTVSFDPPKASYRAELAEIQRIQRDPQILRVSLSAGTVTGGKLVIKPILRSTLDFENNVIPQVTVELEPEWQRKELQNVPIALDLAGLPERDRERYIYEIERDTVPLVSLKASEELHDELLRVPDEERDDWVRKHARVRVYVDEDTFVGTEKKVTVRGHLRLVNFDSRRGGDFIPDQSFQMEKSISVGITRKDRGE